MTIILYGFEGPLDVSSLERPPLCALRALRMTGMLLSREGWEATPHEARLKISLAGSQPVVDCDGVRNALMDSPPRQMKMFQRLSDPDPAVVPKGIQRALGPGRSIPTEVWGKLRPIDRHVLSMIRGNTRLLWRAMEEIGVAIQGAEPGTHSAWTGEVAHVEIGMRQSTARKLEDPNFHDGRALILARVAGLRSARWAADLMDLHSQVIVGAVELGFRVGYTERPARVLCQSHVSTVHGEFFRAGSLLAAMTASAAVADLVGEHDDSVVIRAGRIAEQPWLVGDDDETTLGM